MKIMLKRINLNRNNRTNVTPNGAVVPKREYALEYNLYRNMKIMLKRSFQR